MKLLICIPFHYSADRLKYITHVINYFIYFYDVSLKIIVDTNTDDFQYNHACVEIKRHYHLSHPFHLTMLHRQHFTNEIDNFETMMYIEDDILLPYENYKNYLENFKLLYPNYIPSFVRIEKNNGQEYITDATHRQPPNAIQIGNKNFAQLNSPYHGFWIMPSRELKESVGGDFTRLHESREHAASYPMWGLKKTPLVEMDGSLISHKAYSYHLPCNYALSAESPFGKIKPENIFI